MPWQLLPAPEAKLEVGKTSVLSTVVVTSSKKGLQILALDPIAAASGKVGKAELLDEALEGNLRPHALLRNIACRAMDSSM